MVEVSSTILLIAVTVLLVFQALGAQLASQYGGARFYWFASSTVGMFAAVITVLFGPQIL